MLGLWGRLHAWIVGSVTCLDCGVGCMLGLRGRLHAWVVGSVECLDCESKMRLLLTHSVLYFPRSYTFDRDRDRVETV